MSADKRPVSPEDHTLSAHYTTVWTLLEHGGSSRRCELVPGRPETAVRFWKPLPGMRGTQLGCIESVYRIIADAKAAGTAAGISERLRAAVEEWGPVLASLEGRLPEAIAVQPDGQAIKMNWWARFMNEFRRARNLAVAERSQ